MGLKFHRLLENAHLRRSPHPSSLRRTSKYASLLRISGALHLGIFEQPMKINFFSNPLNRWRLKVRGWRLKKELASILNPYAFAIGCWI